MNYYLKNADATRMYRVVYENVDPAGFTASSAFACATGAEAVLPNGNPIQSLDQPTDLGQVLIDVVLNDLVPGTLAEYKTLAVAMVETNWT